MLPLTIILQVETNHYQDTLTIRKKLNGYPISLPGNTWKPLHNFGFLRTPEEHCHHLLLKAPGYNDKVTQYAIETMRLLRMGMSLSSRTRNYEFVFKKVSLSGLDLLRQDQQLLVDAKFLDFKEAHKSHPCRLTDKGIVSDSNPCDHIIEHLYKLACQTVLAGDTIGDDATVKESNDKQEREFRESFKEMPRAVQLHESNQLGELIVEWIDTESERMFYLYKIELRCRVTLHRESSCADRRNDLLAGLGKCRKLIFPTLCYDVIDAKFMIRSGKV